MKKLKKTLKLLSPMIIPIIGLISVSSASAWGPENRATFTMKNPATYPVFNSITDNPTIGDERNFVRIGDADVKEVKMQNEIEIKAGKQYLVRIYFHNNASATFNDAEHNNSGVATQARVSSTFSKVVNPNETGMVSGVISAENTNPKQVWDEAVMVSKSSTPLYIRYVEGSAKIFNNYAMNGQNMPSAIFSETGTYIGLNKLNGLILGCEQYSGVVSYIIQVDNEDATLDKQVSKDAKNFKENVELKAGEEATFRLTIKNTGSKALSNATINDTLPAGLSYVSGSTVLTSTASSKETSLPDGLTTKGLNLGTIGNGQTVYVTYRAKVSADFKCKGTNLVNKATLTFDSTAKPTTGDTRTDTAKLTVIKEKCEDETKKPGFEMAKRISTDGKDWKESLDAKPGDTAKFNIYFKNTGEVTEKNVVIKDVMNPGAGLEFVPGTILATRSVGGSSEVGGAITTIEVGDELFGNGATIGEVRPGETISITYDVKFVADKFECGTTTLYNNASVSGNVGDSTEVTTVNDSVEIKVTRTDNCEETPPHTDCTDHPEAPECNLPNTGPVEIAMAIAITLGIAGGGYYFYRTKKSLKSIEGSASGKDSSQKPDNMVK